MEDRRDLLRTLLDERFGAGSPEFIRQDLVDQIYDLAEECFVTPREIEGMAVLRYGIPFSEMTLRQLHEERQRMSVLRSKCDHPANAESYSDMLPSPYQLGA